MMKRIFRLLAAGLGLLLPTIVSPGFASAATIRNVHIGNWLAGAYSDDQTGGFSHCAASASYRNGLLLVFAINRKYEWSFGLANPSWHLDKGARYPIQLRVDGARTLDETAVAVNATLAQVHLADSAALFDAFKYGDMLIVQTAGSTFKFQLTSTAALLPSLLRCVKSYAEPQPETATNPFAAPAPAPAPVTGPAVDADAGLVRRSEATMLIANVLARSGVSGFEILSQDEAQKLHGDAAWRAGDTYGLVNVLGDASAKPEDLNASVLASDAKACHDKFFSGSMPDANGSRLFTSCKSDHQTITVFYSTVQRPKGGWYILATGGIERTGLGEGKPAHEADNGIRSAAYKVVTTH